MAGITTAWRSILTGEASVTSPLVVNDLDAGASGTAGTVDVFPSTASKGKVSITAADSAGDTTTTIVNASQAAARTYTIPDAGASASFVMTEGSQTINGTKTIPAIVTTNIDAGASGTAGSVDVFPSTASKGKLAISCTDQAGDTTVSLIAGAMAAARTLTIADPLASADVLCGKMSAVARTATADGTGTGTIAAAGLIQFVAVTAGSDANSIIVLPTPTPGRIVIGYVGATGHELRSSDPNTIAINGGTGAAAESAIAANMMWVAICTSATSWHGFTITAATLAAMEAAA